MPKMSKEEKRLEEARQIARSHVFGRTSEGSSRLEAIGYAVNKRDIKVVSDRKILEAHGHLLLSICDDIEKIYKALMANKMAQKNQDALNNEVDKEAQEILAREDARATKDREKRLKKKEKNDREHENIQSG